MVLGLRWKRSLPEHFGRREKNDELEVEDAPIYIPIQVESEVSLLQTVRATPPARVKRLSALPSWVRRVGTTLEITPPANVDRKERVTVEVEN